MGLYLSHIKNSGYFSRTQYAVVMDRIPVLLIDEDSNESELHFLAPTTSQWKVFTFTCGSYEHSARIDVTIPLNVIMVDKHVMRCIQIDNISDKNTLLSHKFTSDILQHSVHKICSSHVHHVDTSRLRNVSF
jgi:hypothetical protein